MFDNQCYFARVFSSVIGCKEDPCLLNERKFYVEIKVFTMSSRMVVVVLVLYSLQLSRNRAFFLIPKTALNNLHNL